MVSSPQQTVQNQTFEIGFSDFPEEAFRVLFMKKLTVFG